MNTLSSSRCRKITALGCHIGNGQPTSYYNTLECIEMELSTFVVDDAPALATTTTTKAAVAEEEEAGDCRRTESCRLAMPSGGHCAVGDRVTKLSRFPMKSALQIPDVNM